jgi:hypothetical protein
MSDLTNAFQLWFVTGEIELPIAPTVEVNLGGQALERWPSELFVPEELARRREAWERANSATKHEQPER